MSAVVCVVRKPRPCRSYSRRRDRNGCVHWRSLYPGGGGVPPLPHEAVCQHQCPLESVRCGAVWCGVSALPLCGRAPACTCTAPRNRRRDPLSPEEKGRNVRGLPPGCVPLQTPMRRWSWATSNWRTWGRRPGAFQAARCVARRAVPHRRGVSPIHTLAHRHCIVGKIFWGNK